MKLTPFHAGAQAFRVGKSESDNPYPKHPIIEGDGYPGPYYNWKAGWFTARATEAHTKEMTGP